MLMTCRLRVLLAFWIEIRGFRAFIPPSLVASSRQVASSTPQCQFPNMQPLGVRTLEPWQSPGSTIDSGYQPGVFRPLAVKTWKLFRSPLMPREPLVSSSLLFTLYFLIKFLPGLPCPGCSQSVQLLFPCLLHLSGNYLGNSGSLLIRGCIQELRQKIGHLTPLGSLSI